MPKMSQEIIAANLAFYLGAIDPHQLPKKRLHDLLSLMSLIRTDIEATLWEWRELERGARQTEPIDRV